MLLPFAWMILVVIHDVGRSHRPAVDLVPGDLKLDGYRGLRDAIPLAPHVSQQHVRHDLDHARDPAD